jgi:hypothetical protein
MRLPALALRTVIVQVMLAAQPAPTASVPAALPHAPLPLLARVAVLGGSRDSSVSLGRAAGVCRLVAPEAAGTGPCSNSDGRERYGDVRGHRRWRSGSFTVHHVNG